MAKKVKSVEVVKGGARPRLRHALHGLATLAFLFCLGYGISFSRNYADRTVATPTAIRVKIIDPPAWMNASLIERIEQIATPIEQRSSLDGAQVKEVAEILASEPWVKEVKQVRRVWGNRAGDTLEVHCTFRAPVALVQDGGLFWMVDAEGVKLPDRYQKSELAKVAMGQGLKGIQLRVITGVHQPAPQAGEKWQGQDLADGLELAKLFHGKPYLNEVAMIDVSGVDPPTVPSSRRRSEIVLHTTHNRQIIWGEPLTVSAFSVDVPAGQKLKTLEQLYNDYGRLDAGKPWISIRYDSVLYPSDETQSATTSTP
jgi:hypothetical protein